jgi:hypothetical protein
VADKTVRSAVEPFLTAESDLGFDHLVDLPEGALRVTGSLINHVSHWRERTGRRLIVIHDTSKGLAKDKQMWEAVLTAEMPPTEVGYDRRKVRFPLGVTEVRREDSKVHPELQLVDLVAGAMATMARNTVDRGHQPGYAADLRAVVKPETVLIGGVWPSMEVTPEELGTTGPNSGVDPSAFMARLLPEAVKQEMRARRR